MNYVQAFKMALKSIMSNKLRSFLTMLGVIIGVGAVIAVVALGNGTKKAVTDSIQNLGTNMIRVSITGRNSNRNVTTDELNKFAEKNPQEIGAIAPLVNGGITFKFGNKSRDCSMEATTAEYEPITNTHVQSGRFITAADVDYHQKVAIIGVALKNEFFGDKEPINQYIKINGNTFKVIGVLEQKSTGMEGTSDDKVIIPITVGQRILTSLPLMRPRFNRQSIKCMSFY